MKKIIITVITMFAMFGMLVPQNILAHYDTAYWHNTNYEISRPRWMSTIPDNRRLSQISMPGTNDSMAHKATLLFVDHTRTQSLALNNQYAAGIRYVDIGLKYASDHFDLYSGVAYLGYDFDDVLKTTQSFLKNNPSETIVMRLKQTYTSAGDSDMGKVFEKYYKRYNSLFWKPSTSGDLQNPTMKEMRGKIVLMSDISSIAYYGLHYKNANVQDKNNVSNNWALYNKWLNVKSQLASTNNSNGSQIYINYLSGSSSATMPYFVASGHSNPATGAPRLSTGLTTPGFHSYYPDFPRVNRLGVFSTIAFEGTNTLAANYMEANKMNHTGIIVADFPGDRLIKDVISTNHNGYFDRGIVNGGVYFIGMKADKNKVINISNQHNAIINDYNDGTNQKFKLVYDKRKEGWQIKSMINENLVVAYHNYMSGSNVFITQNEYKPEQYWDIVFQDDNTVLIKSWKNNNKVLHYFKYGNIMNIEMGEISDKDIRGQFVLY